MAIHIVDETPDVYLTQAEYDRLMHEYKQAFMFYAGPVPSFETWVRMKHGGTTITGSGRFPSNGESPR